MWSDIRYLSLPEDRRIELFNEFMSDIKKQTAADAAAAAASLASSRIGIPAAQSVQPGSLNVLGSSGSSIDAVSSGSSEWDDGMSTVDEANMSAEDLAQLQLLRWEQAKLRAEYLKMEEKLRAMEIKMVKSRPASPAAAASNASTSGPAAAADLTIHIEVDQTHDGTAADGNRAAAAAAAADVRQEPQVPAAASPSALAAAAAAAAAVAAQQQEVDVMVAGGDGDVSVEEKNGVLVFKFSESRAGSRAASRSSNQEEF
jgi:hypothetical protein